MSKMKIMLHRDCKNPPEIVVRHSDVIPRISEAVEYKGEIFYVNNITHYLNVEYEDTCIIDCILPDTFVAGWRAAKERTLSER